MTLCFKLLCFNNDLSLHLNTFFFFYILAAAYLLVSLVPSQSFRSNFRSTSLKMPIQPAPRELNGDAQIILHTILNLLLRLLRAARGFTEISVHGTGKLTAYFTLMTYCMVTKTEKIMVIIREVYKA